MPENRAAHLIAALGLRPHREGGHYREIHRSPSLVRPEDGRARRAALTTIYFLLNAGETSAWHRVVSDETWHYHEGAVLELIVGDPSLDEPRTCLLGPLGASCEPVRVVTAGWWQAARCAGAYTLVSCSVAPGFEFADFMMLRDLPERAAAFARAQPALSSLI